MDEFKKAVADNKRVIIFGLLVVLLLVFIKFYTTKKYSVETPNDDSEKMMGFDTKPHKDYKVNEYELVNISQYDVFQEYYKDFIVKAIDNPEEAYKLLEKESKREYDTVEKFKEYVDSMKTISTKTNKIEKFRENRNYNNAWDIVDSEKNKFIIIEKSVWNYEVVLVPKIR